MATTISFSVYANYLPINTLEIIIEDSVCILRIFYCLYIALYLWHVTPFDQGYLHELLSFLLLTLAVAIGLGQNNVTRFFSLPWEVLPIMNSYLLLVDLI